MSTWRKRQGELKKRFSWLSQFGEDQSVDAIAFSPTDPLANDPLLHDPYQIESLMSSASSLLDRCLIYRREMHDLEEAATKRALEYDLFIKQLDAQRSIEMADHVERQRAVETEGQTSAAAKFSSGPNDLSLGFAAISTASAQSSELAVKGEQDRKSAVSKKWNALIEYQAALEARHKTPGHALHYGQRFDRVKSFFQQDIAIAFMKIRSIDLGLSRIFGIRPHLQSPAATNYLDYLVSYIRDAVHQVEVKTSEETNFEHVVSIHQPRALSTDGKRVLRYVDDESWNAAINGNGRLRFDLTKEFPRTIGRLRLRGIKASLLTDAAIDERARQVKIAIVVFPPTT